MGHSAGRSRSDPLASTSRFTQEIDQNWKVRVGPVRRDHMLTVLNGFVW